MKIKGGKAFRRKALAAPKSAEGARKAPRSSVAEMKYRGVGVSVLAVLFPSSLIPSSLA